jgi:hypothetical protein
MTHSRKPPRGYLKRMSRKLSILGIAITLVYLGILGFIFYGRITEILLMSPNEIGDLLAGMFGPLAILWLILGFFQQGIELRQNTAALKLQEESLRAQVAELNASVVQQKELVATSRKQLEAEIESLHYEKQKGIQENSPNFVFSSGNMRKRSEGLFLCRIVMKNVGNTAANIRISSSVEIFNATPEQLPSLSFGDECHVRWTQSNPLINQDQLISVKYEDASGRDGEQNFLLDVVESKTSNSIFYIVRLLKSQF